jgi:hypothetical protein
MIITSKVEMVSYGIWMEKLTWTSTGMFLGVSEESYKRWLHITEVKWKVCEYKAGTLVSIKPGKGELYK